MQRVQRFVADQRYDLPQHDYMSGYIAADFNVLNKGLLSPLSRILANWKVENDGGLSARVNNTNASFLFACGNTGKEFVNYRAPAATLLTITLADNAINYVEVKLNSTTCAPDTVAIWDKIAKEEFTQTIDTVYEEEPTLVSNTVTFTGDIDKLRLAIVTTSGGVITNITDARQMLYELESDWDFGVTRTDRTINSSKASYDALATSIKEMKGTPKWFDKPFASSKYLKEYQNLFISGGGQISWEQPTANTLAWTAGFDIEIADRVWVYTVSAGSIILAEGEAMFVDLPAGAPGGPIAPQKALLSAIPIDPASVGYSPGIQVLFFRRGGKVISTNLDIVDLDSGEVSSLGEDLPVSIRARLNILSDTTYTAYTSTNYILVGDGYAIAISKLDAAIAALVGAAMTEEEFFVSAGGGQTIFNTTMTFNALNTIRDLVISVNGQQVRLDTAGTLLKDYRKNSTTQIEFAYAVPYGAYVDIWKPK